MYNTVQFTLTCKYMFGAVFIASLDGHHAAVVLNLACFAPRPASYSLDAVICESGIAAGPFTNGSSEIHVGAKRA